MSRWLVQGATLEIEGVRQHPIAGAIVTSLAEIQVTLIGRAVQSEAGSFRLRGSG